MPSRWLAAHAAGFGPLVLRLAERDCPRSLPRTDGDNAVRLETDAEPAALASYCRSLFRVIGEARGELERASLALAADPACDRELRRAARGASPRGPARGRFVLRAFGPDDPAPISRDARSALEGLVARATGLEAVPPNRAGGAGPAGREREFRVQERADGSVLLLERRGQRESEPRRGELPRTTCRLLAEMTGPEPGDVFLDPFCGYGGIALERALAAPYRFIFASDLDGAKVREVKDALAAREFERRRKTFFPKLRDALDGSAFEEGFVTAVATDPPWGAYEGGPDRAEALGLLSRFLDAAPRLVARGGRLVLLLAREIEPEALSRGFASAFGFLEGLEVLVSGRKARVLLYGRAL
jgi:predicted RNA methylase